MRKLTFEDRLGNTVEIDGDTTISQLINMGVKGIRLVEPGEPLPEGWHKHVTKIAAPDPQRRPDEC